MNRGKYNHLDAGDPFLIKIDMADMVRIVMTMNYGAHRFLSIFVRDRFLSLGDDDELALGIKELLEKDIF